VGCYIWYSEEGTGRAAAAPSPLLAISTVTAHPSTASVPITVLLYDGPLLCGFNVAIKGLKPTSELSDIRSSSDSIRLEDDLRGGGGVARRLTARDENGTSKIVSASL